MSGSNWHDGLATKLIVGTVVVIIGAGTILWGVSEQAEYDWESNQRRSEYASDTYGPAYNACLVLPRERQPHCIAEAEDGYRDNQRDEQDLIAQQTTAIWTFLMGCAAIVGMMLSAVGVYLVYTTFQATQHANQLTKATQRAWMGLEKVVAFRLIDRVSQEIVAVGFGANWRNVGNSPAINVATFSERRWADTLDLESESKIWGDTIDRETSRTVVAPTMTVGGEMHQVTLDEYEQMRFEKAVLLVRTWAWYDDGFSDKRRLSVACFAISVHTSLRELKQGHDEPIEIGTTYLGTYNAST